MSRLDDLGEILDGYKERKYKEEEINYSLEIEDIYKKISEGYEDRQRIGLLVGKILPDKKHEITDIIIPEQNSTVSSAIVVDWDKAIKDARSKGEIIGTLFYHGLFGTFFPGFAAHIINHLHAMYNVPEFSIVMNKNQEIAYNTPKK